MYIYIYIYIYIYNDSKNICGESKNKNESKNNCGDQYIGSAIDFKTRFRIHKSDIKTKKDRCGTARHFNNKCSDNNNPHKFLQVQLIESVISDYNVEGKLWEREKYWQCQLFTNTHDMNSVSDLYSSKRKGCRKK